MFPELTRSVWDGVLGQERAVSVLTRSASSAVHAYLFVGPPGSTKDVAARAFAALLLTGLDDADSRDARLALGREHPDVLEVERVGARISGDQVKDIIKFASLAPVADSARRLHLHSRRLTLPHPSGKGELRVEAEPPPHFRRTVEAFGYSTVGD